MLKISKYYNEFRYFGIIILILVMIFYLFLEIVNNIFTTPDFKVYYRAASDLLAGNNMYNHGDAGHYVFKYSPVFALLLIPFAIFPFSEAQVLYWIFLITSAGLGIIFSFCLTIKKHIITLFY